MLIRQRVGDDSVLRPKNMTHVKYLKNMTIQMLLLTPMTCSLLLHQGDENFSRFGDIEGCFTRSSLA